MADDGQPAGQSNPAQQLFAPISEIYVDPDRGAQLMVLKTYRYLRLGLVLVMVALVSSVLLVRRTADGFEQSISAYYYTPARAVFVGALVATGVALIVIKGWTTFEDWTLNIAGIFAPIVAFVPTSPPHEATLPPPALVDVKNNLGALLIAGWVAWAIVLFLAWQGTDRRKADRTNPQTGTWISVAGLLALLLACTAAFWWWGSFPDYAHGWSAAVMFGVLGVAALGNGVSHKVPGHPTSSHRFWYLGIGIAMLAVGLIYLATSLTGNQWSYEVLEVELVEIFLFAGFWLIQSWERWYWTVRPEDAEALRQNPPEVAAPP